jgi:23S rRNA (uridine2552-2'-O)-methyltransferase
MVHLLVLKKFLIKNLLAIPYNPQDKYFKKAQAEGYRARSVYKLIELNEKFRFLKKQQTILDLGCAPGSWLQYLAKNTSNTVIGVDLKEIEPIFGTQSFVGDVFSSNLTSLCQLKQTPQFDVILSDMAPKTTGIFDVDQYASVELNLQALEISKKHLKSKGWAVFKIFRGADFNDFWLAAKKFFPKMKTFKPNACRKSSKEIYCVGRSK